MLPQTLIENQHLNLNQKAQKIMLFDLVTCFLEMYPKKSLIYIKGPF